MFLSRRLLLAVSVTAFLSVSLVAQSADDALVRQFYPPSLTNRSVQLFDYARADLDGTGTQSYIVVAYGNGVSGVVRVIRTVPAPAQVAAETAFNMMVGDVPFLRLADLDGDGKPEIVAGFAVMGGQISWPIKWTAGRLALIGPSQQSVDGVRSTLSYVQLLDVDGDGKVELIEWDQRNVNHTVYAIGSDGVFAPQPLPVLYADSYVRHDGEPEIFTGVFRATAGTKLTLTIANGDPAGNQVTSGHFYFNGIELLTPNDFKKAVRKVTFAVTSASDGVNEVEADLDGKPGTHIAVSLSPQQ